MAWKNSLWVFGAIALCAARAAMAAAPPFAFQPPLSLPTGQPTQPVSIAVGDFNQDGRLDLAVANAAAGDSTVTVFLNTGARTFGSPQSFAAGFNPRAIVTADFNGDGILDLAVTNNGSTTVSVLLSDGLGGFGSPVPSPAGLNPLALAVGDFDGDGKADLAVSNLAERGANLQILLGNGGGGFGAPRAFQGGDWPIAIVVGDFNGDAKADLAVANFNSVNLPAGNTVSVYLGDGMSGLSAFVEYPVGLNPISLITADLNDDGRLDLAVADSGGGAPGNGGVSVLLGDGSGGFGPANTVPIPAGQPSWVTVGDLNFDGFLDLAVTRTVTPSDVLVFPGDGTGQLGEPSGFAVGLAPQFVVSADFDSDGKPDLASANALASDVSILWNSAFAASIPTLSFPMALLFVAALSAAALWTLLTRSGAKP